jgi:hypothetical protein
MFINRAIKLLAVIIEICHFSSTYKILSNFLLLSLSLYREEFVGNISADFSVIEQLMIT